MARTMTDEAAQRRQLDAMLARALECQGDARQRYLEQACGDDAVLRARLDRLLAAANAEDGLLRDEPALAIEVEAQDSNAFDGLLNALGERARESAGDRIGAFVLREVLGEGGMGVVWRAERADGGFEQEVALKVVRGGTATGDRARRLLSERQILAKLEHPGIARLLDGGVDRAGRPWFALELVIGQPLLEHCRAHSLSLRDRLKLVEQVVRAVDYAHRNLLVHRDIKPANVIVTAEGQAKLLDFGIAKLLDESSGEASLTQTQYRPMTPQYASPEQLLGEPITTASDVYQLGLLLYELLTGNAPFAANSQNPSELIDAARSRTSLQPGQAAVIPADVDAIVMMATRPEPERRYASAGALAADIRAFLNGHPVTARGDSFAYRARRFAGRHRLGMTASALALVAAIGLTLAVIWGYVNAERERLRAVAISDFLKDTLSGAQPFIAQGRDTTVLREIIDRAADRIDTALADRPYAAADVHLTIAGTLRLLSDYERATLHAAAAAEGFEGRLGASARETLNARWLHGLLFWDLGRYGEAEDALTEVVVLADQAFGRDDLLTLKALSDLGLTIRAQGRLGDAEPYYREAVALRRQLLGSGHEDTVAAIGNLAFLLAELGRLDEAEPFAREAAELSRTHLGNNNSDTWLAVDKFAALLGQQGRLEDALTLHQEATNELRRLLGERHSTTLGSAYSTAIVLRQLQRNDEAIETLEAVVRIVREEFGQESRFMWPTLNELGRALLSAGRPAEALSILEQSRTIAGDMLGVSHHHYAVVTIQLADALLETGSACDAAAMIRGARAVLEQSVEFDSSHRYFDELVRVEAKAEVRVAGNCDTG